MRKGITLLVITALALFLLFALMPTKLDYTDRVRVRAGLNYAAAYKEAIGEYWRDHGVLPTTEQWEADKGDVSVDFGNSIVESIHVGEERPGTISVYYTSSRHEDVPAEIHGSKIILIPVVQAEQLAWSCKGTVPVEFMPPQCK